MFNFEAWREYIEYREIILTKYYYPSIFNSEYKLDQPYENYVSMLDNCQPMTFNVYNPDEKLTRHRKINIHKNTVTKELVQKLLNLHDEKPAAMLNFECSFTPLKDAFQVILESPLKAIINTNLVTDFSDDVLEYYFDPKQLVDLFADYEIELATKTATFPKNFSFEKPVTAPLRPQTMNKDMKLSHETIAEKKWIKNLIKQEKENRRRKEQEKVTYHIKTMSNVLKKRFSLRKSIKKKISRREKYRNSLEYDEIADTDEAFSNKHEELTFVHPDFNLWHRKMRMKVLNIKRFKEAVKKLPKTPMDTKARTNHIPFDFEQLVNIYIINCSWGSIWCIIS